MPLFGRIVQRLCAFVVHFACKRGYDLAGLGVFLSYVGCGGPSRMMLGSCSRVMATHNQLGNPGSTAR